MNVLQCNDFSSHRAAPLSATVRRALWIYGKSDQSDED